MLGKVFQYEVRSCMRLLLPLFALGAAVTGLLRLLDLTLTAIWPDAGVVTAALFGGLTVLVIIGVIFGAMVYVTARFYQSMVGHEAYLTFTLPVRAETHLAARMLNATLFVLLSCAAAVLYFVIFFAGRGAFAVFGGYGAGTVASFIAMVGLLLLVSFVYSVTMIVAAIGIGPHLTQNRILGSVAAYFILNTVQTILLCVVLFPILFSGAGLFSELMGDTMTTGEMLERLNAMWLLFGLLDIGMILLSVANFFTARYYFVKKLNLE